MIGFAGRIKGISGGEMKRLAFAAEVFFFYPFFIKFVLNFYQQLSKKYKSGLGIF